MDQVYAFFYSPAPRLFDLRGGLVSLRGWPARLLQIAEVVRLRPFATDTEAGRSRERHRRAALTSLSSAATKVITGATLLLSVKLTLPYLGNEQYAVWVVISSTLAMLTWSDCGLGNGLMNVISDAHGRDDRHAARVGVSSSMFLLTCVAMLILVVAALAYRNVDWAAYFKVSGAIARAEYSRTFIVCLVCFSLALPFGIVSRIHSGLQEGYIANFYTSLASLCSLVGIMIGIHFRLGLVWLAATAASAPLVAGLVNAVHLFVFRHTWLMPRRADVRMSMSLMLLRAGMLFLVLQASQAIGFQSDNVVIARVMGTSYVPQYSLPSRLFQFVPVMFGFVLASLWPAYREAVARGDVAWAQRTFYRSVLTSIGVNLPVVAMLLLLGPFLLRLWVGDAVHFSRLLLIALAVQVMVNSVYNPIAFFLNGMGVLGPQAIFTLVMAVVNITASILLTREVGISGVVWGSSIALSLCSIGPGMFYARRAIRKSVLEAATRAHAAGSAS